MKKKKNTSPSFLVDRYFILFLKEKKKEKEEKNANLTCNSLKE